MTYLSFLIKLRFVYSISITNKKKGVYVTPVLNLYKIFSISVKYNTGYIKITTEFRPNEYIHQYNVHLVSRKHKELSRLVRHMYMNVSHSANLK